VRELENAIERAINLAGDDPLLRAEHFDLPAPDARPNIGLPTEIASPRPLDEVEKETIRTAVSFYAGNIQKAAASLGISRNTLYRKMKEYDADDAVSYACESEKADRPN
jgi:transcriptional regulator with PAS, ATPase and Fis domain